MSPAGERVSRLTWREPELRELLAHAARMGVSVHVAHLPAPYRGWFDIERSRAVYDFDLTPIEQRCVLAHELGHAHHGHECEDNPDHERLADIYAAHLLIHPEDYARAEQMSHDTAQIADDLDVTPELIDTYQRHCLTRLRGVSYATPRMGIGQWRYRSAYA